MPAYGIRVNPPSLVYFPDLRNPGLRQVIGETIPSSRTYNAGAFAAGDSSTLYLLTADKKLYAKNTATGTAVLVGNCIPSPPHPFDGIQDFWTGMSWDFTTGRMYAVASFNGRAHLHTINLETGQATYVGTALSELHDSLLMEIAFDAAGTIHGIRVHQVNAWESLLRMNKNNALLSFVGMLGSDNTNSIQGMDFHFPSGTLYWAYTPGAYAFQPHLRTINTGTGASSPAGDFPDGERVTVLAIVNRNPLAGDLTGSGGTAVADAVLCLRILLGLPVEFDGTTYFQPPAEPSYPDWLLERARVSGGDEVGPGDVSSILRMSVGLD